MDKPRRKNQPVSVDISHARSPCTSWYRCNWWGEILYTEASRLGVVHPFFAPTILDGRVGKFATGQQYSFSPASQLPLPCPPPPAPVRIADLLQALSYDRARQGRFRRRIPRTRSP